MSKMNIDIPERMPRRHGARWLQSFGQFVLSTLGWKLEGELPNEPKLLLVLAPHTSNWDFIIGACIWLSLDLKVSYMMKKEAFFWPFKRFFINIGGIPIDRTKPQNIVRQAVKSFRGNAGVWLGITPEGTRKKVTKWKTGFLRIAHDSGVPLLLIGIDAKTKTVRIDRLIETTGDHNAQAEEIRQYMNATFQGINPENQ